MKKCIPLVTVLAVGFSLFNCSKELDLISLEITGIDITAEKFQIEANDSLQLNAVIIPVNAVNKKVIWKSDDPSVATVKEGRLYGLSPGQANIMAIADGDAKISSSVTINVIGITNEITLFKVNGIQGLIKNDSIHLYLPSETNLEKLMPIIDYNGARIAPESGTEQDFTNPVTYTVTAENGETKQYVASVKIEGATAESSHLQVNESAFDAGLSVN